MLSPQKLCFLMFIKRQMAKSLVFYAKNMTYVYWSMQYVHLNSNFLYYQDLSFIWVWIKIYTQFYTQKWW